MIDATVIVLTKNEQLHIGRLLSQISHRFARICIVDSESSDSTRDICGSYGADIYVNPWPGNHALQINWALDNIDIVTRWVVRLDADEVLSDKFLSDLDLYLESVPNIVGGIYLQRKHVFLGKKIRFGKVRATKILRVWRNGCARCDNRLMDEKISLSPGLESTVFKGIFWDWNLNGLSHWIEKHNDYSSREALQLVVAKNSSLSFEYPITNFQITNDNRKMLYGFLPLGVRGILFFGFQYFLCGGFLDGLRGFQWHFFQVLWYRQLVDAKVLEFEAAIQRDWESFANDIHLKWGYRLVKSDSE